MGQIGFSDFEQSVHYVEDQLLKSHVQVDGLIDLLEEGLNNSLLWIDHHIGDQYFESAYTDITIKDEQLKNLENKFLQAHHGIEYQAAFLQELRGLRYLSFNKMLMRYNEYVERMANDLEKSVLPVRVIGPEIMVALDKGHAFADALVGLFRNAMVHGIETPEERVAKGKDSSGIITCILSDKREKLFIEISDDGRGINFDQLPKKAVFQPKKSSKEEVTLLAGRGLGLSSVKERIEALEGTIDVTSVPDYGTSFLLEIPLTALK